jgi:hypothetical protein
MPQKDKGILGTLKDALGDLLARINPYVLAGNQRSRPMAKGPRPWPRCCGLLPIRRASCWSSCGDETNGSIPAALEPGVTVKIYVPEDDDSPELRRRIAEEVLYHLGRLYPLPPPVFRELARRGLGQRLERALPAVPAGPADCASGRRGWPPSRTTTPGPTTLTLVLDPGMAFGTGLHPTTQSCLRALEDLVQPGASVLDAGTGSGILAIAARGWARPKSPPLTPTRWPCGPHRTTPPRTAWPSASTSGAASWTARPPPPGRGSGTSSWPTFWPRSLSVVERRWAIGLRSP